MTILIKVEEFQNLQHQPSVVPALEDIKPHFKTLSLGLATGGVVSFTSSWWLAGYSLVFTDLDLCERIFLDKKYGNWQHLMTFQLLHERVLLLKTPANFGDVTFEQIYII